MRRPPTIGRRAWVLLMPDQPHVLRVDGSITDLPPREPTLEELQAAVGGYIEVLQIRWLGRPGLMVLDEQGKLKGKPVNFKADEIARTAGLATWDVIVGDVVVLVGKEVMLT